MTTIIAVLIYLGVIASSSDYKAGMELSYADEIKEVISDQPNDFQPTAVQLDELEQ